MESSNKVSFSIPSLKIPSLASSSDAVKEKENNAPKRRSFQPSPVVKHSPRADVNYSSERKPSSSLRTPLVSKQPLQQKTPSSALRKSASKPHRVLRYGESMESVFCLSQGSTERHRSLCEGIADGSLADDPSAWRKVLELAARSASSSSSSESDLFRLHRRAIIRFPLEKKQDSSDVEDVLSIWISYAEAHAINGAIDEARRTFRHIENQSTTLNAEYYLKQAHMESKHDKERVEGILIRGINKKASPTVELVNALQKWRGKNGGSRRSGESSTITEKKTTNYSTSPKREAPPIIEKRNHSGSPKREAPTSTILTSSKRIKTETGGRRKLLTRKTSPQPSIESTVDHESKSKRTSLSATPTIAKADRKPIRLLASKRLSSMGSLGQPARVNPDQAAAAHESESDGETDIPAAHGKQAELSNATLNDTATLKPKLKKVDLGYMWDWDPSSRTKETKAQPTGTPSPDDPNTENPSTSQATGSTSSTVVSTTSSDSNHSQTADKEKDVKTPASQKSPTEQTESEIKPEPLANINREFLPLVHEANVLRVNSKSYVKLGVIGKGGSCKVYRALTKKCEVVAIKKVKLEGMDAKAIEGYANEIALLKRLRQNPAIIHMHDSEVDLKRKSIFVVMEPGETDLNQVLKKRADAGTCRSLNMNFIRLTWQQMLSAVHSIHQERIIHSDLKPANFLFVRGALKLIDFGIAKAIQSDDTTNVYRESQIGTLNYMSPEAIMDDGSGADGPRMKIGRASDVWSLGCILYEMVYGKTPFAKYHFIQKLQAIVNPNTKIDFPDDVDATAVDAIQQCLRRNPEDRPPIMGSSGLLNEHIFLHGGKKRSA
ncbi:unnamed protein product [Cylindrotheca closterium]|uniref:Protein kinase domain-containing protein n=1 Tax=Cylindrotheca closterium TaxID=2856 RepID=A0AAD2CSN1_9STRA|nr:unnamed protein product [Cylindrotheca closterium]